MLTRIIVLIIVSILYTGPISYEQSVVNDQFTKIQALSKRYEIDESKVVGGEYTCPQNGLDGTMPFREMQEYYYQPSPNIFCGFATRYGSDSRAISELYWEARQLIAQFDNGYALLGGDYGFHTIDGYEYLIDNRSAMGYSKRVLQGRQQILNEYQLLLYHLGKMKREEFIHYVITNYVGVISIKSPNDIGREMCLYSVNDSEPVGTVIIGGTAAAHDWLPIGYRSRPETISLGLMTNRDPQGELWSWSADLPDSLYYLLDHNNQHPKIRLVEGRCYENIRPERTPE